MKFKQHIGGLLFAVLLCSSATFSAQQTGSSDSLDSLEKTISFLENKKELEDVTQRLKALVEARKEAGEATRKAVGSERFDISVLIDSVSGKVGDIYSGMALFVENAVDAVRNRKELFQDPEFVKSFYRVLFKLGLAVFLTLLFLFFAVIFLKGIEKRMTLEEAVDGKTKAAGLIKQLSIYTVSAASFFGFCAALVYVFKSGMTSLYLQIIMLCFGYVIAKKAIVVCTAPEGNKTQRMLPLENDTALYVSIWAFRYIHFAFWLTLPVIISTHSTGWEHTFYFRILAIGLCVLTAVMLAQQKDALYRTFAFKSREGDLSLARNIKKVINTGFSKLYLVFVGILLLVGISGILGYRNFFIFTAKGMAQTALILCLYKIAAFFWDKAYSALFEISEPVRKKHPGLDPLVNRYVAIIGNSVHFFLFAAAFLSALDTWGIKAGSFMIGHAGYFLPFIRIPLIVIFAVVAGHLIRFFGEKLEVILIEKKRKSKQMKIVEIRKQIDTIGGVLQKGLVGTVWILSGIMILKEIGFEVGPLIAGAGIAGVAIGFGSQSLVKDFISGLLMLLENQIRVGDVAVLNGTGGLVEEMNLRTTVLRGLDGTVHIFPNGSINSLSNMTREFSFYLFDIGVAYKEDVDRVMKVLREISDEIVDEEPYKSNILEPLEILGLDKFGDSAIVIKARIKTLPIQQWMVGREMNRRIKKRFDAEGIEIPFPHRTVYFGEVKTDGEKESFKTSQNKKQKGV